MAPDFEIFRKIEIMCMISFFPADLRLSAHWTPGLRIADLVGWGMTLTQKPRIDYVQTSSRRTKLAWRKPKHGQKQGIRPNAYVTLGLTKVFRS